MFYGDIIKGQLDRGRINPFTRGIISNPPCHLRLGLGIYITIRCHIKDTWHAPGKIVENTQKICLGFQFQESVETQSSLVFPMGEIRCFP